MPFVKRDEQGAVVAVSETCGVDCAEELPADDEALMAFLQAVGWSGRNAGRIGSGLDPGTRGCGGAVNRQGRYSVH